MRTPLGTVRGLGSAKDGTEHFWRQRLTAFANVPLAIAFVMIVIAAAGATYEEAVALVSSPLVALILLGFVVSATVHMRIGMQVVIEDYIAHEGAKVLALFVNTLFAVVIGLAGVYAIIRIGLGG